MKQVKVDEKDFKDLARYQFLMDSYKTRYLFSFDDNYLPSYLSNYKLYQNTLYKFNRKYNLDSFEEYNFNIANLLIIGKERK